MGNSFWPRAVEESTPGKIQRLRLHIYLHMQGLGFDPIPALVGSSGYNMKRIVEASGAKVNVRDANSGRLDRAGSKKEVQTPLVVAVSAPADNPTGFRVAVQMTLQVLKSVSGRYRKFCAKQGVSVGAPYWSFSLFEEEAKNALKDLV